MTNETLPSLLREYGYSQSDIDRRTAEIWHKIFEADDKVYFTSPEGFGYVVDTGNDDVRTEGMSYAMMLAVQYDRKDIFDGLWQWVMTYMFMHEGPNKHYFAWSVDPSGTPNADGPAPDGEEWFAFDLFLADSRWGSGEGVLDYDAQARSILRTCVHAAQETGGNTMWNLENHLIKFVPEVEWTDPSYHLPHFYDVFAQRANEADRPFWAQAAEASRAYLVTSMNPNTGLNPEYSNYDGTPRVDERDHWRFYSDAYRTPANCGLDALWNEPIPALADRVAAQQEFLLNNDPNVVYTIEGEATDESVLHPVGLIATTAQGSLAARYSKRPGAQERARQWVEKFWNTPLRDGPRRYYDNFLYAFAFLALSGRFKSI